MTPNILHIFRGYAPRCRIHGVSMIVYSTAKPIRYFKCPREGCPERAKASFSAEDNDSSQSKKEN